MRYLWKVLCISIGFTVILFYIPPLDAKNYHPEIFLTIEQKVQRHGYPLEVHRVETEDDYILSFYRVPYSPYVGNQNKKNKSIVMLLHGMGGSPENFLFFGKDSLPYYFADRDMDVWLFSSRGTPSSFSQHHKKWDWNEDQDYWRYSSHEIAVYDLTAAIDYALNQTDQEKVFLIGHSAGGTEIYMMLAERPEYNDKVKIGASWGNAPLLKRIDFPLAIFLATIGDFLKGIVKYLDMAELFPHNQIFKSVVRELCAEPDWIRACVKASWFIGSHRSYIQEDRDIGLITSLAPPRVATNQAVHFMDNLRSQQFQKFDFGAKENLKRYGTRLPPVYNTSAIVAPIAFFFGNKDSFFIKKDYYESAELLPNVVYVYEIPYKLFTHSDFILARNATYMAYEPTYRLFKNYDEGIVPPRFIPPKNYLDL